MGKQDRVRTRPGGAHWVLWQWPRCAAWQKALCAERGAESPRPPAQPQSGTRENQQSKDVLGLMHRMASALRDCKTLKRTSRIKCSFTLFKKTDHNIPSLLEYLLALYKIIYQPLPQERASKLKINREKPSCHYFYLSSVQNSNTQVPQVSH